MMICVTCEIEDIATFSGINEQFKFAMDCERMWEEHPVEVDEFYCDCCAVSKRWWMFGELTEQILE